MSKYDLHKQAKKTRWPEVLVWKVTYVFGNYWLSLYTLEYQGNLKFNRSLHWFKLLRSLFLSLINWKKITETYKLNTKW